jgi:hypothetical protein
MQITKISTISGKSNTMDLNVTQEQLDVYAKGGVLIQNVFPNLNPSEREFIKSGITPTEWTEMFG